MSRTLSVVSLTAAIAASAWLHAQQPEFRVAAATVPVHATVVDSDGQLVGALGVEDFEVYDNGRRQPITVFDAGQRPISIVVMLDRSGTMDPHAARVEAAARAFVANLLPEDRVRIGTFGEYIRIRPETFTSDQAVLYGLIDRSPQPSGATPLWRATNLALDALMDEEGQRVVLVFTDGRDTPAFSEHVTFDRVLSRVRREETMVYAVGLAYRCEGTSRRRPYGGGPRWNQFRPGAPISPQPPRFPGPARGLPPRAPESAAPAPTRQSSNNCRDTAPDPDLRELAAAGGGGYFELKSSDDLRSTFERVAQELHSQYLIGFAAPDLDGRLHDVEVRVTRPGVSVRARRTYLAGSE
ncbi:MAG: hypothetical protein ABS36_01450 [Acidobacteria bacterium SCN 69-37]|nr:MAG: hypothetical protein ABS36_01450 [Acidobacteria bacterium SCN 69-37]